MKKTFFMVHWIPVSITIVLSLFVNRLNAQTIYGSEHIDLQSHHPIFNTIRADVSHFFSDADNVFSSPMHYKKDEWINTAAIISLTIALIPADNKIDGFVARQHGRTQDIVMEFGRNYGRVLPAEIIAGGLYTAGFAFDNDEIRTTGRMAIESLIFSGLITSALKTVFDRNRPYNKKGPYDYEFEFEYEDPENSFPSGHATVAFALSTVLAHRIHNPWASLILYSAAGITSVSRLYHDAHWTSDVLFGSAIGYAVGNAVVSTNEPDLHKNSIQMVPAFNGVSFILTL